MRAYISTIITTLAVLVASPSRAASFGDWFTGTTDDGLLYAAVVNDSGGSLLKGCNPAQDTCIWYLVTSTPCDQGVQAPALFSSSGGSVAISLGCDKAIPQSDGSRKYRYFIYGPDTMDKIIESTTPLGIAVALEGGRFQVYRFSMSGSKKALMDLNSNIARTLAVPKNRAPTPRSTKDTYL